MKKKNAMWLTAAVAIAVTGLTACGIDMPKEEQTSFETLTVKKTDITVPLKFSAKLKGQTDVTITPQVSGQLMQICVTEGQQVRKGQTLFVIDQRNALLEVEAAEALSVARETMTSKRTKPADPSTIIMYGTTTGLNNVAPKR